MQNFRNKIIITLSVAALLFVSTVKSNAQEVTEGIKRGLFGLRFMPTLSSLDFQTSDGGTVKGQATVGFGAGMVLGFNFSNHVGIQSEIIYSSLAQKQTHNNVQQKVNINYVNIPLLLSLNTGKSNEVNLKILAGPQIGIRVKSALSTSGGDGTDTTIAVLAVRQGDFGFAYGAGLDFAMNEARTIRFDIGYRGVVGLVDISNHSQTTETNGYYILDKTHIKTNAVYVGVTFLF